MLLQALRWVWQAGPARLFWELFLQLAQSVLQTVTNVWLLYRMMQLLEAGGPFARLAALLTAVLALQLVLALLQHRYNSRKKQAYSLALARQMQQLVMARARTVGLHSYDDPAAFDLLARARRAGEQTVEAAFQNLMGTAGAAGMLVSSAAMIAAIDKGLFFLGLLALPAVWVTRRRDALLHQYDCTLTPARRRQAYVSQVFLERRYAQDIRLTNLPALLRRQAAAASEQVIAETRRQGPRLAMYEFWFSQLYINLLMAGCYAWALVRLLVFHSLTLPAFSVMLVAATSFTSRLRRLFANAGTAHAHVLALRDLQAFLALPAASSGTLPPGPLQTLSLQDVSFCYPGSEKTVLSHLSLQLRKGEKVVLAGFNGAGKSTLLKLLLGFYAPTAGTVCANGRPLQTLDMAAYRRQFGVLFQDFQLYQTTVAENVLLRPYDPVADSARVWHALRQCGLAGAVAALPQKEQTPLGREFAAGGAVLSGGQQQKLALARLWAADSEVLLVDEPSAALDPLAEEALLQQIFAAAQGRTLVLISHRLSCARLADRVLLLEEGRLLEDGPHDRLMERKGKYAQYFALQAEKYRSRPGQPAHG